MANQLVNASDVSKLLKTYRKKTGLTHKEVSERLGSKNQNLYRQYETKPVKISLEMFDRIITALGLNLIVMVCDKKLSAKQLSLINYVIESGETVEMLFNEKGKK